MKRLFIALGLSGIWATPLVAEGTWTIGAFAAGGQSPYVGDKDEAALFPYLAYDTDTLHIGIDGLSYTLLDTGDLAFDVILTPRFAPDFPKTDLFDGLKRDDALELGFDATYAFGAAYVGLAAAGDITDAHEGYSAQARIGYTFDVGDAAIDLAAGVEFRDAKLNNYLYGVADNETTATRTAFDVGDSTTAFASLSAVYPLSNNIFMIGEVSVEDLGDVSKSPLVDRDRVTDLTIGVGFQF
ncbi:MAG: MipA/OmpV family protein [Pseudomonadota bacterium]